MKKQKIIEASLIGLAIIAILVVILEGLLGRVDSKFDKLCEDEAYRVKNAKLCPLTTEKGE